MIFIKLLLFLIWAQISIQAKWGMKNHIYFHELVLCVLRAVTVGHQGVYCSFSGTLYFSQKHRCELWYSVADFIRSKGPLSSVQHTDPLEVHDCWWRSPHEEPPLQVNPGAEHPLCGSAPPPAHRHTAPEQAARALGPAQLSPAHHLQELQHFWTVV